MLTDDWIPDDIKHLCDRGFEIVIKKKTGGYIVKSVASKELQRIEK